MSADERVTVRVHAVTRETASIKTFDLRPSDRLMPLPAFSPGAHVVAYLGNGISRSYSLINCTSERHRYQIAVDLAADSRGGSRWMHENVRDGDTLAISRPRNNFALSDEAPHSVLIAGGIGITPLLSMLRHLDRTARPWSLHYSVRSEGRAAFLDELRRGFRHGEVRVHCSDLQGAPDLASIVRQDWPPGTHFYCCGPSGMLEAFLETTDHLDPRFVHIERFDGAQPPAAGGFELVLARSRRTLSVVSGESILDCLLANGVDVPHSCRAGVCGSCELRLLDGRADHRDAILTPEEKAANASIFVCCSGSLTPSLTLDL